MKIKHAFFLLLISTCVLFTGCKTSSHKQPAISFDSYKIADGFEIQLATSEPLIEAPVAMDFDNQGRMWIVEMRGYMPNLAGTGEDAPNGRISILEDLDKDGRADHSKVFLDSLVLPRAIAHVYGGLLYAVPPNLWFAEINDDKPGKKILVDSLYSDGGNPENQPNGLITDVDNWIYSANSNFRYQRKDGKWIKEPTSFRGQWGIAKDNYGRLYYNYNEIQLAGDYVPPNTLINNPYLKPKAAINKLLTDNQRVYPLHFTTVNRGYVKGILNADSLLVNFTAACGPLIYRGGQFPEEYNQNAFVCEPEANLIKRDILTFDPLQTTARQAWDDREFIASTDEGFRPVNLLDGPDGAMYVVDMHRGIMQHRADETPYYRNGIAHKELDTLLNAGRILRIKSKSKNPGEIPDFDKASGPQLVTLLKSDNGWIRDRAQQLLIYKQDKSVIPALQALAEDGKNAIPAIHALHTLDGLNGLSFELLQKMALSENSMLSAHALLLLENYAAKDQVNALQELSTILMAKNDTVVNLYLAVSLGSWMEISKETFMPILAKLSRAYSGNPVFQEAIISSLKEMEDDFKALLSESNSNKEQDEVIDSLLAQVIKNRQEKKMNSIFVDVKIPIDGRQNGYLIFRSTCSVCHGADGDGIQYLGPPLNGSEYVAGSTDRLAMIILNGVTGPIHVNGQLYKFNSSMPNFGNNFNDQEIVDIITYVRNSFVPAKSNTSYHSDRSINAERIKNLRDKKMAILTEKELLEMPGSQD